MKKKINKKAVVTYTGFISALVVGMLIISFSITPEVVVEKTHIRSWHTIFEGVAAEANPGSGASGILEIYFINHTTTPTIYSNNTTTVFRGWCNNSSLGYASADDFRVEIAHSVAFDIVVRVRGNKTVCWNGSAFIDAYLRVNITSPNLGIAALTNMTGIVSYNDTGQEYIWINFYINNAGSGYTITRGNETQIPTIIYEGYY